MDLEIKARTQALAEMRKDMEKNAEILKETSIAFNKIIPKKKKKNKRRRQNENKRIYDDYSNNSQEVEF